MKIYETSAVFLVIGSVLLGPIAGKYTTADKGACGTVSHESVIYTDCLPREYEPTAKTCERALLEIGAKKQSVEVIGTGVVSGRPDYVKRWFVDGVQVLCVPAPTRLR